jgi:hypothetical protein
MYDCWGVKEGIMGDVAIDYIVPFNSSGFAFIELKGRLKNSEHVVRPFRDCRSDWRSITLVSSFLFIELFNFYFLTAF